MPRTKRPRVDDTPSSSMPPPSSPRVPPSSSRAPPPPPLRTPTRRRNATASSSRQRRPAPTSPTPPLNHDFISLLAQTNYTSFYRTKTINPGRQVIFSDFASYNIGPIFDKLGLVNFCSISHAHYPTLIKLFFANLRVDDNGLTSRVNGKDVAMSYKDFANFIGLPDEGLIIHLDSPQSFDAFPDGHSIESMNRALNHNPSVVLNNVSNYNLQCQIIAKIVLTNLLPKSGEFDVARGCAPLLIYFILCGIPVNIPQLILHQITNANLLTARGLPYGMLLSSLFVHWGIPTSGHESIDPSTPIDRGFLARKSSHLPADRLADLEVPLSPTTTSPPPLEPHVHPPSHHVTLSTVMDTLDTVMHTLTEIACAVRYNFMMISDQHADMALDMPRPSIHAHPLPHADPPFPAWEDPFAPPAPAAGTSAPAPADGASTSAPPPSAPPVAGEGDVAVGDAPGGASGEDGDAAQT